MDFSRQVNYQSDFDVLLTVKDSGGAVIGFPEFDFILTFFTNGAVRFGVGQVNGVMRGVRNVGGKIGVAFDDHKMMPGVLNLEFRADVKDETYPDGKKLTVFDVPTGISLVSGNGELSTGLEIEVTLPFQVIEPAVAEAAGDEAAEGEI